MAVDITNRSVSRGETGSPRFQYSPSRNALSNAHEQSDEHWLDYFARAMLSRRAQGRFAAIIYALVATVVIAQIVIAFGPQVLVWAGAWAVSVLIAYVIGGVVGLQKGRDEYRPWR